MANELLKLVNVKKSYSSPGKNGSLEILKDINLTLFDGESIAITGRSGSGKSTLLSVAALLLPPSSGSIFYLGEDITSSSEKKIAELRNKRMGFIFQSSMLLEDFSALENVAMPLLISGERKKDALEKARYYLSLVDLDDRIEHRPSSLSGGERQRVAIARALSNKASVIFADEPTGALDEQSSLSVEEILFEAVKKENRGLLLVTHNTSFAQKADKHFVLMNGILNDEK